MLKATKFSEIEQGKILVLNNRRIADKIRRNRTPVDDFLKDPDGYNGVHAGGLSKVTSERNERAIVRAVKKSRCSSVFKIKASAGVGASISTIRRVILNHCFHPKKQLRRPLLSPSHKALRLMFARQYQTSDGEWTGFLFSDEKKEKGIWMAPTVIIITGQINAYKILLIPRGRTAEEVIVRGTIFANGKLPLVIMYSRFNAT
ncbi:uncharacterized protein LOC128249058 [Octopus bimaculoides]|uniref:uncharacterized protein LOC128249058 n=1 Tax=Octopus bimaculoides TaxID=37653 RepID=UPI0022E61F9E|nr:uncharacterized protein LOC128249058 [Octopus bimaculoides]